MIYLYCYYTLFEDMLKVLNELGISYHYIAPDPSRRNDMDYVTIDKNSLNFLKLSLPDKRKIILTSPEEEDNFRYVMTGEDRIYGAYLV